MNKRAQHLQEDAEPADERESAADRAARVRYEAALLASRKAHFERFGGVDMEEVDAWLDALDKDPSTPRPTPTSKSSPPR